MHMLPEYTQQQTHTAVETTTTTHRRDNNNNTSLMERPQHIDSPRCKEADEGTQHLVVEEATTTHTTTFSCQREKETQHTTSRDRSDAQARQHRALSMGRWWWQWSDG